jgi:hypothetical protein
MLLGEIARWRAAVFIPLAATALVARSLAADFLFDATKAQMAGNADWVIDADLHNLKISAAGDGSGKAGAGNESNPQRFPTPDQSTVTASTPETYWEGALSAWALDLVKHGHHVETLPYDGRITWRDASNPQDLTNYNVFVTVEPNILFTPTEKAALISFVKNGGGLFLVSDHGASDRNNDGADSVQVLNDLMTNSVQSTPFGVHFNGDDISPHTYNADTDAADPITHGPAGVVSDFYYNNGSSLTVNTNQNPAVSVAVWNNGPRSANKAIVAYGTYGAGKFVTTGDSSPFDDGTGDPGDTLFFTQGYTDPTTGNGKAILNASLWLAESPTPPVLKLVPIGNGAFLLTWPLAAGGYILQASTDLTAWTTIANGIQTVDTNRIAPGVFSTEKQFFRLKP